jgi:hypothetical protein
MAEVSRSFLLLASLAACGDDATPVLDPPVLDTAPALTNRNPVTLAGSALAGVTLEVRGGSEAVVSAVVGSDGRFSIDVPLRADLDNNLLASVRDDAGNESTAVSLTIRHDGIAPDAPALDPVSSPTRRTSARIGGVTEAGATIRVSGGTADVEGTADTSGRFDLEVPLTTSASGTVENPLSIVAVDLAGNESAAVMTTVVFDPTLAIETPIVDAAGPTNESTVEITGSAEPMVGIRILGGVAEASGESDASGAFSVPVGLRPNAVTTLYVFATSGATTSAAAIVDVIHDDVAPEAPSLDPQASPTSLDTISLTGATEPGATVGVSGGAGAASAIADAFGRFAVDVDLTADSDNALEVVATDAAGNAGAAAMLTIAHDGSLPVPIAVDPLPSPTRDNPVTVTGRSEASSTVEITGGAATVTAMSGADGAFMATVTLRENTSNELRFTRPGSGVEAVLTIVHDDVSPSGPRVNPIPSPTGATTISVTGTAEPLSRLSATGGVATVTGSAGSDGRFSLEVRIAADARTMLSVIATDRAGNSSPPTVVSVEHSSETPSAPILDESAPAPVNTASITLTGRVVEPAAGVSIRVTGGMGMATAATDPATGTFAVEVMLRANSSNELSIVSIEGAITSPPALATVIHDDIAPGAPDSARIDSDGPGLCVVRGNNAVIGTMSAVEGRARVRIRNLATSTTVNASATDGGSFTVNVASCPGDVLSITAIDAAGNASAASEITVR